MIDRAHNTLKKIVIGGVPEHFNLPWIDTLERVDPDRRQFLWRAQPEGTGAMVTGLASGELDAALLLTEGAVTAFARGAAFDIRAIYVKSPLEWGIHVPAASALRDEQSIRGARYAISRFGSGSHLMSIAHARSRGWPLEAMRFEVVDTIDGAVAALAAGNADVFFWERVMTEPLVAGGIFRRVGVFAAPWPAFVLCVSKQLGPAAVTALYELFDDVLQSARLFRHNTDASVARIAQQFGIDPQAAQRWLARTQWASVRAIDHEVLRGVAQVLMDANLIETIPDF
jgi:ABC-type nitrate/sulfonate/bicarbonate transport system substrate-binding protein